MAQLQVPIPDELMTAAKSQALQNKTSLKEIVRLALENFLNQEDYGNPEPAPAPQPKPQQKPTQNKKETQKPQAPVYTAQEPDYSKTLDELLNEEPDPMDERYFYVLKKTKWTDLYEDEDKWYDNGTLRWLVPKDCQAHYDRDNNLIPFRYTMPDANTVKQPTAAEIKEIEKAYGKPVKIEE